MITTGMPSAPVELLQFGQRHITDQTGSCRGAINSPVMNAHQVPVEGESYVALDPVGALPERQVICGTGVFGTVGRRTAVSHHERAVFPPRRGRLRHELRHRLPLPGLQFRFEFDIVGNIAGEIVRSRFVLRFHVGLIFGDNHPAV